MLINLPWIAPIDTEHLPADFEERVKHSFAKYTECTAKDYTSHDRLCYIDNLTRSYIRRLNPERRVREMIHDAVDCSIENCDTMPDDDELLSWEFMEQCYEVGVRESRLYRNYNCGSSSADNRALDVVAQIVRIVMNWEEAADE